MLLGIDPSLSPSAVIADAVKRSDKAHLFHFYKPLCQIAALPRKAPKAWTTAATLNGTPQSGRPPTGDVQQSTVAGAVTNGHMEECDARLLATQCLDEMGKEWTS